MPEDFGSYLKHERELRGISLDEIAQSTKISIRFLRALEESRFEDLPGKVFVKGFIRSYGQTIGSNVDELLAAYDEADSKYQDTETSHAVQSSSQREQTEHRSGFPTKAVLGFVAVLFIIAGGVYWTIIGKGKNTEQSPPQIQSATPSTVDNSLPEVKSEAGPTASEKTDTPRLNSESLHPESNQTDTAESSQPPVMNLDKTSTPATEVLNPIKNTAIADKKDDVVENSQSQLASESMESASEVAMEDSSLKLVIRVDDNSWFNLRVDGERDHDFILPPDGSKTIRAKNEIVITIGNRLATQLTLNGQQLELPKSPDDVIRNLTVNSEWLN